MFKGSNCPLTENRLDKLVFEGGKAFEGDSQSKHFKEHVRGEMNSVRF